MIHGCQDVVRIWQDLAKTAKMLVRGSTRAEFVIQIWQNSFTNIFRADHPLQFSKIIKISKLMKNEKKLKRGK